MQFEKTLNGIESALRGTKRVYSTDLKKEIDVNMSKLSDAAISEIMAMLRSVLCVNTIMSNVNDNYVINRTFDVWHATFMLLNAEVHGGKIRIEDRETICETVTHATHTALLRALDGRERELFMKTQQTNIHLSSVGGGYTPTGVK